MLFGTRWNEKLRWVTRNIRNWAESVNMNELTINKLCGKLKVWYFKMPNISYCHRYMQPVEITNEL